MQEYKVTVDDGGTIRWYQNGELHRLDGPAVEYPNGDKWWYQNGFVHRLDGPAVEYANGNKWWYQNGQQHRINGAAVEDVNGNVYWYIHGVQYSEEKFNEQIDTSKEFTVEQISELLGYNVKIVKG